ncbi:MAG: 50S ribosomal protein L35 [Candidatus Taylorbacteria bacterium]
MSIKTHKSFMKRLKVTKNGKILARKPGQNHFNAKDSSKKSTNKHRMNAILHMNNKAKSRFLATI